MDALPMPAEDLCALSAHELRGLYRVGRLSPVETTRAVLARIAAINQRVNAIYHVDADGALAQARAAEVRWREGRPLGALDGVPVTLKDSLAVAGMPGPRGSRALLGNPTDTEDAPATARLREHGAVLVGKTTMPDFGMIAAGVSSLHGITRNPWNLVRNSGGSSSGAGVAVASGMGPLAVGTDIGGSVRIPASFCGIVGLKPSYGRVPVGKPRMGLVAGPMARDIVDAAVLLKVLSEPDLRDYTALPAAGRDYLDGIEEGVRGLRMGLLTDIGFGLPVQPDVLVRVEAAAALLAQLGAVVEPMRPIFDADPEPEFDRMLQAYSWNDFAALPPALQAEVLPGVATWCRRGEGMSAVELTRAMIGIGGTRRQVVATCAPYDFVLAPTMAVEPYAAESLWPEGGTQHNPFCFPFNLSEQPALSICCGLTAAGLPVGLQIIGRRFDDAGVLRVGRAYEVARGPLPAVPKV